MNRYLLAAVLCFVPDIRSQDQASGLDLEEKEWASLIELVGSQSAADLGTVGKSNRKLNKVREFRSARPGSKHEAQLKKMEALLLVSAVEEGDSSLSGEMERAVNSVRKDVSLPAYDRAAVAGTYEFSKKARKASSIDNWVKQNLEVGRGLIEEFPDQPQGYVTLVSLAELTGGKSGQDWAKEVISSASAPDEPKARARDFLKRQSLLGEKLPSEIFGSSAADPSLWEEGKPGVVYFWSSDASGVAVANRASAAQGKSANMLGVFFGTPADFDRVKRLNPAIGDRQIYADAKLAEKIRTELGVASAPSVFLIGKGWKVKSTEGFSDFEAKLAGLVK